MSDLAPMREQVYTDPRPKEYFDRFHARARTREPDWVYEVVRVLTSIYAYTFLRTRAISTDNVPGRGAVILAPNHFSFMDHFLMGCYIRRKVRFMAKSQLFKAPMQFIYTHGGVFPVRRGARDEEMVHHRRGDPRAAAARSRCTARAGARARAKSPNRPSAGSGAWRSRPGAPVVPIAIHGSSRVRNWKRLQFPKVTVQYGEADALGADREPHARAAAGGRRPGARRDPRLYGGPRTARPQGHPCAEQRRADGHARARRRRMGALARARRRWSRRMPEPSRRACRLGSYAMRQRRGWGDRGCSDRLDVGAVISRVWSIYVDQASVLMPAAAVVFVVTGIISALLVLASPALALVAVVARSRGRHAVHGDGRRARRRRPGRPARRQRRAAPARCHACPRPADPGRHRRRHRRS